jgi:hypothetical protein
VALLGRRRHLARLAQRIVRLRPAIDPIALLLLDPLGRARGHLVGRQDARLGRGLLGNQVCIQSAHRVDPDHGSPRVHGALGANVAELDVERPTSDQLIELGERLDRRVLPLENDPMAPSALLLSLRPCRASR